MPREALGLGAKKNGMLSVCGALVGVSSIGVQVLFQGKKENPEPFQYPGWKVLLSSAREVFGGRWLVSL